MWIYEKKLEYPVKIATPDPKAAKIIIAQLGGPDGEKISFYSPAKSRIPRKRRPMPVRPAWAFLCQTCYFSIRAGSDNFIAAMVYTQMLFQSTPRAGSDREMDGENQ